MISLDRDGPTRAASGCCCAAAGPSAAQASSLGHLLHAVDEPLPVPGIEDKRWAVRVLAVADGHGVRRSGYLDAVPAVAAALARRAPDGGG